MNNSFLFNFFYGLDMDKLIRNRIKKIKINNTNKEKINDEDNINVNKDDDLFSVTDIIKNELGMEININKKNNLVKKLSNNDLVFELLILNIDESR